MQNQILGAMSNAERYFLSDPRIYGAILAGCVAMLFCSHRVLGGWKTQAGVKVEQVTLFIVVLFIVLAFLTGQSALSIDFDWSGEFAVEVVCAFGFILSIRLVRFRGWFYRGAGLLFAVVYGYAIYSTLAAWTVRGHERW
jgi:hypothetical protein